MRDGNWLVGMGVATSSRDANVVTADATVAFHADGSVVVRCGFQDSGMGTGTVVAQVVADEMGVPLGAVEVRYGDSSLPAAPGAFGSMHTSSVINGVMAACAKLRDRLDKLAARSGAKGEGYAAVLKQTDTPSVEASVGGDRTLPHLLHQAKGFRRFLGDMRALARGPLGAQFCEVRVHADTGEIRISRWVGAFDIGAPLNEKLMVSQLKGAIVMGIGMALTEEILVDPRTGRIMNPHLSDYHVPVHADIPKLDIHYIVDPDPTMPHGMYGLGELGVCGAAPAVSNAVYHATGHRVRDFPITPDKLLGL
jgi:xanthine dehydrogenase YagR molybdenum-binding subunit